MPDITESDFTSELLDWIEEEVEEKHPGAYNGKDTNNIDKVEHRHPGAYNGNDLNNR